MLVIRLFRVGKKNQPFFKVVVTEKSRAARRGRFVEEVGFYNPKTKEKNLKSERIKYWISKGAQPSDTLQNLLISEKIIEGKKTPIYMKKKPKEPSVAKAMEGEGKKEDVSSEAETAKEEKPVQTEEPIEEKPKEEVPKEPASAEASAGKEKPAEEPKPAEPEKPAEEKPVEEAPKEEKPKEEKSVKETKPAEEKPVKEEPKKEIPKEEATE